MKRFLALAVAVGAMVGGGSGVAEGATFSARSAGDGACAVQPGGTVACWGGRDATNAVRVSPVVVPGIDDAKAVSGGANGACALRTGGGVSCWGDDSRGQLGNGTQSFTFEPRAQPVSGLTDAVAVSYGALHVCAVRSSGKVVCWGSNDLGELGNGAGGFGQSSSTPVTVLDVDDAVAVAAGNRFSCAVRATGGVVCWAAGGAQLGNGDPDNRQIQPRPVAVSGLTDAVAVSAGGAYACARRRSGAVSCWGSGPLGDGSSFSGVPVTVSGLGDAVDVTTGGSHACAARATGTAVCWGNGTHAQLGTGDRQSSGVPVPVVGVTDVKEVAAGGAPPSLFELTDASAYACARKTTGAIVCWGHGATGELGDGFDARTAASVPVDGMADATTVSAGFRNTCAVRAGGTVACWGVERPYPSADDEVMRPTPVVVAGISDARSVSAGRHTCVARASGNVVCWGLGNSGQLGGSYSGSFGTTSLVTATGLTDATSVTVGREHTCALRSGGTVACWGSNVAGQLGNGGTTSTSTPTAVPGLVGVAGVDAGGFSTCAVLTSGLVRCWGSNASGQLGNGTTTASPSPVSVSGLTDATSVSVGGETACARRATGAVACWGAGPGGRLGNGGFVDSTTPVPVSGLSDAAEVSVADDWSNGGHACARRVGGSLVCWGLGPDGQLGNPTARVAATPVPVSGIGTATGVSAGLNHTCALLTGGAIRCWGNGARGQLGDGSRPNGHEATALTPVIVSGTGTAPDTTAPIITITTPATNQRFSQGQVVSSVFSCSDGNGSGVASCSGPAQVDTSTVGTKTFTVTSSDRAGNSAVANVQYIVDAPAGGGGGGGGGGAGSGAGGSQGGTSTGSGGTTGGQSTGTPQGGTASGGTGSGPGIPSTGSTGSTSSGAASASGGTSATSAPTGDAPKFVIAAPNATSRAALHRGVATTVSGLRPGSPVVIRVRSSDGRLLKTVTATADRTGTATTRVKLTSAQIRKAKGSVRLTYSQTTADGARQVVARTTKIT